MSRLTPFLYVVRFNNQEKADKVVNHDEVKRCTDAPDTWPKWLKKQKLVMETKGRRTYCICGSTDDTSFMLQCGVCFEWFHGFCVKVTQTQAERNPYTCDACTQGRQAE